LLIKTTEKPLLLVQWAYILVKQTRIITGLGARKRKGDKSRVIKEILYAYFSSEKIERPELKSTKKIIPQDYSTSTSHKAIMEPATLVQREIPILSDQAKETLKKNLDELSDMFM
jgi:hypothetical protein